MQSSLRRARSARNAAIHTENHARFYAFTLSVLVNKSLEIFILALLEGFSFLLSYYSLFTVFVSANPLSGEV